jgi:uncharacterized membrane protein YoaT (DUF817 family)
LAAVPLFSGFMYAAIGSYMARAWRLLDLRFVGYPPLGAPWLLAVAAYVNFFSHHYLPTSAGRSMRPRWSSSAGPGSSSR